MGFAKHESPQAACLLRKRDLGGGLNEKMPGTYLLVAFGWMLYTVLRLVLHTLMLAVCTDTLILLHVQTAFFTKPR